MNDIRKKDSLRRLLILKNQLIKKSIKRYGHDSEKIRNKDVNEFLKKIKNISDCNNLVYLPLNDKTFILPLVINFDFALIQEDKNFYICKMLDKGNQTIEEKIKILDI